MKQDASNKRFWDRFAGIYTAFMRKNDASYRQLAALLAGYLSRNMAVLELACGTGQLTVLLAEQAGTWEATDFSPQMIAEAEKRNRNQCVHFQTQDAAALTYGDASFDAVVIANALHIMPDPDAALREIHRVLRPGGLLYAPTFVYEAGYAKPLVWLMERFGFRTFHKWRAEELAGYVCARGFTVCVQTLLRGSPLPECALLCRKSE